MSTLNYGIVGCGMMGQEHIRNISLLPGCRVTTVHEPDEGMRERTRALLPDVVFTDSVAALVATDALDAIVIASPNFRHVEHLREITARRTIPILVEKPIATEPGDEAFVRGLHADYGAPIWVAMEYRFMPPLAKFLDLVEDKTGGVQMLTIREHRFPFLEKVGDWNRFNRFSGGTLVEKCCHFFDLMRLIMRAEPVRMMGSGSQMVNHLDEVYGGQRSDIWDGAYAIADFETGTRAMLEICMFAEGSRYQEEISAVGPEGKIECLIPGPTRFWPDDAGPPPTPKVVISRRGRGAVTELDVPVDPTLLTAGDHHGSTFYQHRAFREVLLGRETPQVTLLDGWKAVAMGMAAQKSARDAVVVPLDL